MRFTTGAYCFGSEIKEILAVAPDLADVSPDGVLNFFYFGYVPDPLTAFSAIHKRSARHLSGIQQRRDSNTPILGLTPLRWYEPKS